MTDRNEREIIVFDALCVLCTGNARFILRHDHQRRFALASMQGEAGKTLLTDNGIDPVDPDTLIVITRGCVLRDSDAVLHIYTSLGWPWRASAILALVPRGLRDPAYRFVARHRYRLFGRRDECWVPDAADRERLL